MGIERFPAFIARLARDRLAVCLGPESRWDVLGCRDYWAGRRKDADRLRMSELLSCVGVAVGVLLELTGGGLVGWAIVLARGELIGGPVLMPWSKVSGRI